jgi:hypothetical protein
MSHRLNQEIGVLVDFDGTLTRTDTCRGFLQYRMRHSVCCVLLLGCVFPVLVLGWCVPRWRTRLTSLALWLVTAQRSPRAIARLLRAYGSTLSTRTILRPEMIARLHWHVRQGHRIVVVSASCSGWIRPILDAAGLTEVHIVASRFGFWRGGLVMRERCAAGGSWEAGRLVDQAPSQNGQDFPSGLMRFRSCQSRCYGISFSDEPAPAVLCVLAPQNPSS